MKGESSERILVTTALECVRPIGDDPLLFLGEWCRIYSQKKYWYKRDAKVSPYHWDNRNKLFEDYGYLQNLFERILDEVASELNTIHGTEYSSRYWRIVVGPWLLNFIPIVFDRWSCLESTIPSSPIKGIMALDSDDLDGIPLDMNQFSTIQEEDWWNSHLFSLILKVSDFGRMICWSGKNNIGSESKYNFNKKIEKSRTAVRVLEKALSFVKFNSLYCIITPYLRRLDNVRLHVKLHQIPVCNLRLKVANQLPESKFREWKFSNFKHNNDFERILIELIPFQIPIAYLEAFKRVKRTASSGGYPDSPKLIWTSNSFYSDDVFKVWAAGKVEKGVLFLIGQHGGHYGQGKYSFPEYHELKICDHYLSWGWGGNIKKINPIGVFKNIKKENKHKYKHKALLVVSGAPRYSGTIISMPIAGQVLKYIDQQLEFYEELPRFISNDVVVRLYPHDYGWCQLDRWKGAFPDVEIDTGSLDFDKQIRSSKVIISGWNSTAYIESFLADIPTVLFWNFTYFELRDDAIKTFDNLKRAGILHDSPIAAAKHLGEIWDDVDAWWSRPDVVIAKSEFINKYAAQGCIVNKLNTFLKSL